MTPVRVTAVLTHPVQYYAPWFRHIAANAPAIDLTVLYATAPSDAQQGVGFGERFQWDVPLTDGYRSRVVRPSRLQDDFSDEKFRGLDVPEIATALRETRPEAVLVPGWHSATLLRALLACRRAGLPALYRGDSNLLRAPRSFLRRAAWSARTAALLQLYSGYLFVGARAREHLERHGVRQRLLFESPHCVDNDFFANGAAPHQTREGRRAARAAFGLSDGEFVVLFVGKLISKKRPRDLVEAMARLAPGARLLVVGSGEESASLRELASARGLPVAWAGFRNQRELPAAYAAADCLVLPSDAGETWGLAVNEALATGLPCVVGDQVGCAPDLIVPGATGEVFPTGDVAALADAIERIRARRAAGHDFAPACRARAATHSLAAATDGLLHACRTLVPRPVSASRAATRILAPFGDMVAFTGLERMSFEVLRVAREHGAQVHCVVNSWSSSRIVAEVERIGATHSSAFYGVLLDRRARSPRAIALILEEIARTSLLLLRDARRLRPTHVLLPSFFAAIRNAPALALLRARGVRVVLRLGNAPLEGRTHRFFWRRVVNPVTDLVVANSRFTLGHLLAHGVPEEKTRVIYNTVPHHEVGASAPRDPRRLIFVGQIIPEKGLHVLLDALELLAARGIDATLDVVGRTDGWLHEHYLAYRRDLLARIERPPLAGRVRLLGWRDDVPAVLAAAAIHCCPSLPEQREAFGVVIAEAKRTGLPSVALPSGALPELIEHRVDGWICPDFTAAALAEGLAWFLTDEERAARAGRAAAASYTRFTRERFAGAWWDALVGGAP